MSIQSIVLIAVILALDCFAVSVASGLSANGSKLKQALTMAVFFGIFQGGMAFLGWKAGLSIQAVIASFDHWIAFSLLLVIGLKMIKESRAKKTAPATHGSMGFLRLISLSVATSIDALAVGLSFVFFDIAILLPALTIGGTSLSMTLGGFYLGNKIGPLIEQRAQLLGGIVLIGIGSKILVEHLFF